MENTRTTEELRQLQALPLDIKIKKTQLRIREAVQEFGEDGLYMSFSGGKDSQVLLDIIRKMGLNKIPVVWCNTGLENKGSRTIAQKEADIILRPELTFRDVLTKYGYPVLSKELATTVEQSRQALKKYGHFLDWQNKRWNDLYNPYGNGSFYNKGKYRWLLDAPFRISNQCCKVNKEKPLIIYQREYKQIPIIATMASESLRRKSAWLKTGCNAFNTSIKSSKPLSFWTEKDIYIYILENDIKIAEEYGEIKYKKDLFGNYNKVKLTGDLRTGCTFCLFGISQDVDRLVRLKEREPKIYNYIMSGGEFDSENMWIPNDKGLGYKFVIDWLNEHLKKKILY